MNRLTEYNKSTGEAMFRGIHNNRIYAMDTTDDEQRILFDAATKLASYEDREASDFLSVSRLFNSAAYDRCKITLTFDREILYIIVDRNGEMAQRATTRDVFRCQHNINSIYDTIKSLIKAVC